MQLRWSAKGTPVSFSCRPKFLTEYMHATQVECIGYACFFFLTEAKIPDRVATGGVHGVCLSKYLTEAKIPDRVATCNTGGVHRVCLFLFPDRGQNS